MLRRVWTWLTGQAWSEPFWWGAGFAGFPSGFFLASVVLARPPLFESAGLGFLCLTAFGLIMVLTALRDNTADHLKMLEMQAAMGETLTGIVSGRIPVTLMVRIPEGIHPHQLVPRIVPEETSH